MRPTESSRFAFSSASSRREPPFADDYGYEHARIGGSRSIDSEWLRASGRRHNCFVSVFRAPVVRPVTHLADIRGNK